MHSGFVIVSERGNYMDSETLQLKFMALQNGDIVAFEEIYTHLKVPMYTIILRITRDWSLSEDI